MKCVGEKKILKKSKDTSFLMMYNYAIKIYLETRELYD